ncbi:hypothetical protein OIY81_1838, partial [Cryptosporidium canis]
EVRERRETPSPNHSWLRGDWLAFEDVQNKRGYSWRNQIRQIGEDYLGFSQSRDNRHKRVVISESYRGRDLPAPSARSGHFLDCSKGMGVVTYDTHYSESRRVSNPDTYPGIQAAILCRRPSRSAYSSSRRNTHMTLQDSGGAWLLKLHVNAVNPNGFSPINGSNHIRYLIVSYHSFD